MPFRYFPVKSHNDCMPKFVGFFNRYMYFPQLLSGQHNTKEFVSHCVYLHVIVQLIYLLLCVCLVVCWLLLRMTTQSRQETLQHHILSVKPQEAVILKRCEHFFLIVKICVTFSLSSISFELL